jgi:hypothetical protein
MTLGRPRTYPDDAEPLLRRSIVYRARDWANLVELSRLKRTSISAELRAHTDSAGILAELSKMQGNIPEKDEDALD